jgi:hypothetical protein
VSLGLIIGLGIIAALVVWDEVWTRRNRRRIAREQAALEQRIRERS